MDMIINRHNASNIATCILNGTISENSDIAKNLKAWFNSLPSPRKERFYDWDKVKAQELLDKGYPIIYIAEKVGLSSESSIYRAIKDGMLSDKKRNENGYLLKNKYIYEFSEYGRVVARGTLEEIAIKMHRTPDSIHQYLNHKHSNANLINVNSIFTKVPNKLQASEN